MHNKVPQLDLHINGEISEVEAQIATLCSQCHMVHWSHFELFDMVPFKIRNKEHPFYSLQYKSRYFNQSIEHGMVH